MASTTFSGPVHSANGFVGNFSNGGGASGSPGAIVASSTVASSSTTTIGATGTAIAKIIKGTVTIDPASLGPSVVGEETVTLTGAVVGDVVMLRPPTAGVDASIIIADARVTAVNEIKFRMFNPTVGSINVASGTWLYMLIRS